METFSPNTNHESNSIDLSKTPQHIAIIMDGNGRWAKQRNKSRSSGHKAGVETLRTILKECTRLNINYLSVYAFSTENWKRPQKEVSFLMKLLSSVIKKESQNLHKNGVKVKILGSKQNISTSLIKNFNAIESLTQNNTTIQLNLMINYGSREELLNAVKISLTNPAITSETITEQTFSNLLYTSAIPDPELLIRTSGEKRLSNFLLWQISYAELYFTETHWPDFSAQELQSIISNYQNRDRRFGGL